jgi:hypothetical protein
MWRLLLAAGCGAAEDRLAAGNLTTRRERLWPPHVGRGGRQAEACRRAAGPSAQCIPAPVSCIILKASSIVKLLGFWMGGKSLKVAAHCPIAYCAPYKM